MDWLWPIQTGQTFFDGWSVVHFCFFLFLGANFETLGWQLWVQILVMTVLAYGWEVMERYWSPISNLINHPESWLNSWVSDPIVDLLGGVAGIFLVRWMNSSLPDG